MGGKESNDTRKHLTVIEKPTLLDPGFRRGERDMGVLQSEARQALLMEYALLLAGVAIAGEI